MKFKKGDKIRIVNDEWIYRQSWPSIMEIQDRQGYIVIRNRCKRKNNYMEGYALVGYIPTKYHPNRFGCLDIDAELVSGLHLKKPKMFKLK